MLNNPLIGVDPTGLDCVYVAYQQTQANNYDGPVSNANYALDRIPGDYCPGDGYYFDGTVDLSSVQVNPNGDLVGNVDGNTQCAGDCPDSLVASDEVNGGGLLQVPLNGGQEFANNSWVAAFRKNLLSVKNFINEFRHGGCVNTFVNVTADSLNPFSPSLSTAGEGTAAVLAASKYNAVLRYAASQPNFLGGTGLIYPMKSSVVRSMVADANATAASGGLMSLDLALAQGFGTEMYSMATGGCH